LIQINLKKKSTKNNYALENTPKLAQHLTKECPKLTLNSFMYIPPPQINPTPFYKQLTRLQNTVQNSLDITLPSLNIKMNADLEQTVHYNTTIVQIKNAIFNKHKT